MPIPWKCDAPFPFLRRWGAIHTGCWNSRATCRGKSAAPFQLRRNVQDLAHRARGDNCSSGRLAVSVADRAAGAGSRKQGAKKGVN